MYQNDEELILFGTYKRYRKLCRKEYSKETGITTIKVRWIIINQQPFSIIKNADFRAFIAVLDQQF